jgi:hypothetical protein
MGVRIVKWIKYYSYTKTFFFGLKHVKKNVANSIVGMNEGCFTLIIAMSSYANLELVYLVIL